MGKSLRRLGLFSADRERGGNQTLFTPQLLSTLLALVFFWSWTFLFFWSDALAGNLQFGPFFSCKGAGLFGNVIGLLTMVLLGKAKVRFLSRRLFGFLVPVLLTPIAVIMLIVYMYAGVEFPRYAIYIFWFLSGFGMMSVLIQCGGLLCHVIDEAAIAVLMLTLFLSALLCLFLLQCDEAAVFCFMLLSPILSSTAVIIENNSTFETEREVSGQGFPEKPGFASREARRGYLLLVIQQLVFSTVFSFGQFSSVCFASNGHYTVFDYFWIALFFSGVLYLFYGAWLKKYLSLKVLELSLLLLTALSIVFLTLINLGQQERFACCVLLCFGFTSFDVLSMYRLGRVVNDNKLPFGQYFAFGRLANSTGMLLGWGIVFFSIEQNGGMPDNLPLQYGMLVAFSLLVIYFAIAARLEPKIDVELNDQEEPGAPESKDKHKDPSEDSDAGRWRNAVHSICVRCQLSPRETDVFILLCRGRDTGYICDSLFISASTVKTHSYHIYQKLGVHSQQELITMVEEEAKRQSGPHD